MLQPAPQGRFVFDGFDADAMLGKGRGFEVEHRLLSPGRFRACIQRFSFPEFSMDFWSYTQPVFAACNLNPSMIAFAVIIESDQPVWANGRRIEAGQIMVFPEGGTLNIRLARGRCLWGVIHIARDVLQQRALKRLGRELRIPDDGCVSRKEASSRAEGLREQAINLLLADSASMGLLPVSELSCRAEALLDTLVSSVGGFDSASKCRVQAGSAEQRRHALICDAEAYIRSRRHLPYSAQELSSHLGLGERQLERAFRDAYGYGPCHWHQLTRLNYAHRELRKAKAMGRGIVTEIATGFGFTHLGRFSVMYRNLFGESPRDTLAFTPGMR